MFYTQYYPTCHIIWYIVTLYDILSYYMIYCHNMIYCHIRKQTWLLKPSKCFITSYSHIHIILIILHQFKKLRISWGSLHGILAKVLDCGLKVSEFKLQSCYSIHFQFDTLGQGMNPLNNLMMRFLWCWSFGKCWVPLHCHGSQVLSGLEW